MTAEEGHYDGNLGSSFERQAWRWIQEEARRVGPGLRKSELAGQLPKPLESQVRDALKAFSVEEWRNLIERFTIEDQEILRPYLYERREDLERWIPAAKLRTILDADATRGLILDLERTIEKGYRITVPTDPYWVVWIHQTSRQREKAGAPRPKARTWPEVRSDSAIASSLSQQGGKVSPYKVKTYRERMDRVPLEAFDGSPSDYFFMIASTKAYKAYIRQLEIGSCPRSPRSPLPPFLCFM